jgi:heat shock protein HslJ
MHMKRLVKPLVILFGLTLVLVACGQADNDTGSDGVTMAQLDGLTFVATDGTKSGEPFTVVDGSTLRVSFSDGQIAANAGCNNMGGAVSLDGDVLVVDGGLIQTEMACSEPLMRQEQWFSTFLSSKPTVRLNGATLTLTQGTDEVVFSEQQPPADQPLVSTTWQLDGIIKGAGAQGSVSSVPVGIAATVQFDDSGRVSMYAGCNRMNGQYTEADGSLTLSTVMSTKMACSPPEAAVEAAMLSVLDEGETEYLIDGDTLTLTRGDAGLVLKAAGE